MNEFRRILSLILIMAAVAAMAVATALYILYQTALNEERARLMETAQSQARLIEAIARFDAEHSEELLHDAKEATLSQIIDAHSNYTGFGETGEFTLAERKGDRIVFLLSHRHFDMNNPKPVPLDSELAEPMRRALSGRSGTVIGLDYRGETVLAAYEPVNALGRLGIVAKIDLNEIRAPFLKAAVAAGFCALFVVLIGSGLFFYISNPLIRRLRDNAAELQRANDQLKDEIAERKQAEESLRQTEERYRTLFNNSLDTILISTKEGTFLDFNPAALKLFGYTKEEMEDLSVEDIYANPDDRNAVLRELEENGFLRDHEVKLRRKDGTEIYALFNTTEWRDSEGKTLAYTGITRDITEQKRAEATLRAEKERAQRYLDIAPSIMMALDTQGTITLLNREGCRILECDEHEAVGKDWFATFLPEDTRDEIKEIQKAIANGKVADFEYVERDIITAKGNRRIIRWHNALLKDEQGEFSGTLSSGEDVTDRKQDEERIRYLNAVLRAIRNVNQLITKERDRDRLLEGACDNLIESLGYHNAWIAIRGASGEFTTWAHAGFDGAFRNMEEKLRSGELTRCGQAAMAQSDVVIVESPESECPDCPLEKSYRGKGTLVIRLEHEDIVYGIMAISVPKHFIKEEEQLSLFREVAGDIAFALYKLDLEEDRRKTEEELRRYEHIVSSSNDLLALLDTAYRYQAANSQYLEAFGLRRGEIIGRSVGELFGETVFNETIKPYADRCLAGEPVRYERFFTLPEWGRRTLDVEYFPYYEKEGTVGGFVVSARDITNAKQLEERLAQSQKMEAIGSLAGGIAHDFNNILSAIIGFTELALDDAADGTPQNENLQDVLTAGRRAKALVSQILTFSRQRDEEQKPVQVLPVLKDALKLLRSTLPSTVKIREHLQVDEGEDIVLSNPTQVQQIVMNLCTNAADAMEDEGGVLEVRLGTVILDIESAAQYVDVDPGAYLKLAVIDTGQGMERETARRIFEPYFTTKANGKGTGMGLAVVHGIVKALGGAVTVYSEPGQGTTFHVYIPQARARALTHREGEEPLPTGTERLLFVDDEHALLKLYTRMLGSLGYTVETESSSIEALARFRSDPDAFDLVVTDMTMPQMTGETLAKEILRMRPGVPIILCTGYSERVSAEKCRQIGVKAFLLKPVEKRDISKVVRRVLDEQEG